MPPKAVLCSLDITDRCAINDNQDDVPVSAAYIIQPVIKVATEGIPKEFSNMFRFELSTRKLCWHSNICDPREGDS